MNNNPVTIFISWETRNWRHTKKAISICKDFGLESLTKQSYIGKLYTKERYQLEELFNILFQKKTDTFFMFALCQSCYNMAGTSIGKLTKVNTFQSFEMVQVEPVSSKNP
ncbi:MAG: hypothetical protein JWL92_612 [Candidatus Nomurabacteria bacterium]|nr:hypothetical protein [Candidatus Nomurabacteria bacterium]